MNGSSTISSAPVSASTADYEQKQTVKPSSTRKGPSNGNKRSFKQPADSNWVQKGTVTSENKSITNATIDANKVESTPKQNTPSEAKNGSTTESAQDKEKQSRIRIRVTNIHTLVTDNEFLQAFKKELDPIPIEASRIIYYGPKSTGKGWVEIDGSKVASHDITDILKKMNGYLLREQPLSVEIENKNNIQRNLKKKNKPVKVTIPYLGEIGQVKTKFSSSFRYISEKVPIEFELDFAPSDPDFPYDISKVHVIVSIPEDYPNTPCRFTITNDDIPDKIKKKISDACYQRALVAYKPKPAPQPTTDKQNKEPPAPSVAMILGLLKWLDNNLEKLMVDKQLTQEYHLQQHGIEILTPKQIESHLKITAPPPQPTNNNNADLESADDLEREQEESESEEEDEEDGSVTVTASNSSFPGETSHKGTQVAIGSLELHGIGIVEVHTLNILFQCSRCRHQFTVALAPKTDYAVECEKCHQAHIASLRPEKMHEASSIVGYLDLEGCAPFDLLPSIFDVSCLECLASNTCKNVDVHGNIEYSINCMQCHKKIALKAIGVKFTKIRASATNKALANRPEIKKKPKQKDPNMAGIKLGQPLPEHGTCKHYKKSKRWLRFPCCGRAFPCDECHQDNNKDGHEMKWATRMICGECSKEQSIANKQCVHCGVSILGTGSHFWEGGQGCRNPNNLSKKDPHKFKNLNKTQSNKANRVGPKTDKKS